MGLFSQALQDVLNRVQYGKPPLTERQATFTAQLANFWQYFTWQFARDWGRFAGIATALFTVLGLSGLWTLWKTDRRAGLAAAALLGMLSVGLVYYMNFKYGFSHVPRRGIAAREVRERDYFFMGSFSAFGVFVALGLGALMRGIADFLGERAAPGQRWAIASAGARPRLRPAPRATRRRPAGPGETMARDFAHDILQSVEPYGILITAGDNDTFPLWYAQEVEGIRRDVTLANLSLMNTEWHLRQLKRRADPGVRPGRGVGAAVAAVEGAGDLPRIRVLSIPLQEIDSLPEAMRVPPEGGVAFDSLQIRFGQDVLLRQDLATIFLIRDNLGKRPVFFSWSDGGYPDQTFGLSAYLISQGFVRKLMPTPVTPNDSIVLSPGLGFVDLPRTRALLWDVYHWQTATRERPAGWVDPPSGSILQLYSVVYGGVSETLRKAGDSTGAARADSVAREVSEELRRGAAF